MKDIEYLDDERKKIWKRITDIEKQINKNISDYEKELRVDSKYTSEYRNKCKETLSEAQTIIEDIKTTQNDIVVLHENAFSSNTNIETIYSEAKDKITYLETFIAYLNEHTESIKQHIETLESFFSKNETYKKNIEQLNEYFSLGNDTYNKITSLHKASLTKKRELDEFHREIFGYIEEDENNKETKVEGLKDKLQVSYEDISDKVNTLTSTINSILSETELANNNLTKAQNENFCNNLQRWENEYTAILNKINSLLPAALTAGLSSAYNEKRKTEEKERKKYEYLFGASIIGLVAVSLITFIISFISWKHGESLKDVILDMPRLAFGIIPLYLPVLWIAYSSNKRLNLSKRLIEEYSHKEVLSKTFEGLSNQIENIENENMSEELKIKLLYNMISVSSENPGKLITDYNTSDHPLTDALNKSIQLANAVDKLSEIPGLKSISKFLDNKSEKIVKETSDSVNKGFAVIDKKQGQDDPA